MANEGGEKTFILTSPPFSCGLAWLANVLLELEVRTTHWPSQDAWRKVDNGWALDEQAQVLLAWHLPILHRKPALVFRDHVEVLWEHRFDFAASKAVAGTILYLRDPRDAIYSMYLRDWAKDGQTYQFFLYRRDNWRHHFPGLFYLPPPETYILFIVYWMTMGEAVPVLTITFEGMRANPEDGVTSVLNFLNIERSDLAIVEALGHSNFQAAKDAMERTAAQQGIVRQTARSGTVGEWRTSHDAQALARFDQTVRHYETLLRGLDAYDREVLAVAHDDLGIAVQGGEGIAEILAIARPALLTVTPELADFSARAAIVAAYWTATARGDVRFTSPTSRRLFRRFYCYLLACRHEQAIVDLMASEHFSRILGFATDLAKS